MDTPELPVLGYAPADITKMTNGVISRTRVYEDMKNGKLRAKKAGPRTIITPEAAKDYIANLPDRPTKTAAA